MIFSTVFWFGLAAFFLLIELGHPGLLFFLALALGSAGTGILSLFHYSFGIQILGFWIITIFSFLVLRKMLRRLHPQLHATNVYSLINKEGIVIEPIDPYKPGYIQVEGQSWLARSDNPIQKGAEIIIIAAKGVHVVVRQKEK